MPSGYEPNEVLEQVKALPPRERRKFFECIHELETTIASQPALSSRGERARELIGAGKRWLKPGADPVGDLIREREQDDRLDQADERQCPPAGYFSVVGSLCR
jgi:hypothetical protein